MKEPAWSVECKLHGLLSVAETRAHVPFIVGVHWVEMHGAGAAIEGRDWMSYPAVPRCDTCNVIVEPPFWQHSVGTPLGKEFIDYDGLWMLCDRCHAFRATGDLSGWMEHYFRTIMQQTKTMDADRDAVGLVVAKRLRVLLDRLDMGTRVAAR